MSPIQTDGSPRRSAGNFHRWRRVTGRSALVLLLLALTAGCSSNDLPRLAMPSPITTQGHLVLGLWQGGWIAAFFIGAVVAGLIVWCVIFYRKRGEGAPAQITYNGPIEILYTVVPIIFVAIFFYFTARDESDIDKLPPNPDVTVEVVGFQWDWQFNYLTSANDETAKTEAQITGDVSHGNPAVLVLPAGESVRFKLVSPDVIHSFWVPKFLFKRDVIPGRENQFEVNIDPGTEGTYIGRCTELCGLNHDQMIFYVKVVDPTTYKHDLAKMEAAFQASTGNSTIAIGNSNTGSTS